VKPEDLVGWDSPVWPETFTGRVAAVKQLLPGTGADAIALSTGFGKKNPKRTAEISAILTMLQSLGGW
jgi:hypothetical protein